MKGKMQTLRTKYLLIAPSTDENPTHLMIEYI